MDIEIRPMRSTDLEVLVGIGGSYTTEFVWQMDLRIESDEIGVRFTQVRLPREMRVGYPWPENNKPERLAARNGVLVAEVDGQQVGYLSLQAEETKRFVRITDLMVLERMRRRQIGSTLLQAAAVWQSQLGVRKLQLELQTKNHPAICLATRLGYEFSGYSDQFFPNRDTALFFTRRI